MSDTKLTTKDIDSLAALARLKIDEKEKASLVTEIDAILAYVDTIKKATVSFDATPKPGAVKNITRDDTPRPIPEDERERILAEVPQRQGDFVTVKKIL